MFLVGMRKSSPHQGRKGLCKHTIFLPLQKEKLKQAGCPPMLTLPSVSCWVGGWLGSSPVGSVPGDPGDFCEAAVRPRQLQSPDSPPVLLETLAYLDLHRSRLCLSGKRAPLISTEKKKGTIKKNTTGLHKRSK